MSPQNHPAHEQEEDTEPVGTGYCGDCDTHDQVYATDTGLRCADCRNNSDTPPATYTPTLLTWEDETAQEIGNNVDEFMEELPDIGFDVELADGSTYEMSSFDSHAVIMKHGSDWDAFLTALAGKVQEHFEKETEPTKFADYASWGASNHDDAQSDYETHAELAPVVAYSALRGAKMQMAFEAMSGSDEDGVTVIGMDSDSLHQYGLDGRTTIKWDPDAGGDLEELGGDES